MRFNGRTLATASALIVGLVSSAQAQGPLSTGTFVAGRDQNWDVAVGSGPFVDAFQVASNPGWFNFTGPTSARYISFAASASNPGGSPYTFRTTFDLTGYDPSSASLSFQCGVDNNLANVFLNGVGMAATCPFAMLITTNVFSTGFIAGLNTLDFVVVGDGTTDGFIYDTVAFSADIASNTAPEPASLVLFASGLGALVVIRRRRRRI